MSDALTAKVVIKLQQYKAQDLLAADESPRLQGGLSFNAQLQPGMA